ncbi:hypothetical protein DA803_01610 [[Mycoplasma] phocae]|uniref:Integrase catalytic domain-containing protein n=2 Tax=[Mycoplasma] phocae TaxID=142651 RepID=A0A2Z5IQG1_9BACT|nr:hypothetical protein DA803_01610 [[Mycoplasma] phocae]
MSKLKNNAQFRAKFKHISLNFTEYKFRKCYENSEYKSKAYIKRYQHPPKEAKYNRVWTNNKIKDLDVYQFGQVWTTDIRYIKCLNKWKYLHVIRDHFTNLILSWSLSDKRTAEDTTNLIKKAITKFKIFPKIFHTDHGIEYANNYVKNFLEKHNCQQSMSAKGCSLENRGSEYFFANLQRENIDLIKYNNLDFEIVNNEISKYIKYYNLEILQKNIIKPHIMFFTQCRVNV